MKRYFTISIVECGNEKIVYQGNQRKVEKWLYDYFISGEEKWWAWHRFNNLIENPNITFEKYVKLLTKIDKAFQTIKTIRIRQGKMLLIRAH